MTRSTESDRHYEGPASVGPSPLRCVCGVQIAAVNVTCPSSRWVTKEEFIRTHSRACPECGRLFVRARSDWDACLRCQMARQARLTDADPVRIYRALVFARAWADVLARRAAEREARAAEPPVRKARRRRQAEELF
jgi:hypothetical protein